MTMTMKKMKRIVMTMTIMDHTDNYDDEYENVEKKVIFY